MRHKIGLVYVPGALPCFEVFGNLPTDLVRQDGMVRGKPASEVLDMLIIPGGSLVESKTIKCKVARQISKMADEGKFVLGICSGFQILSKGTDIGRLSPSPLLKEGLGLLDVNFKPLICTDQVKATIVNASFLTNRIGAEVAGFHCHTYGDIAVHKQAKPILLSHVNRLNYRKNPQDLVSGASNNAGNVVGIITHGILDQNQVIIDGITQALDISPSELLEIRKVNQKLQREIVDEVGISTNIHSGLKDTQKMGLPRTLLITALESGGGKTFIATGLAGMMKKRGLNIGVVKVGGDIRDIVPALYLTKEPMRKYSSITVAECGWKSASEAVKAAGNDYDFLLIEGAMNMFTGILFDQMEKPNSTAEVAAALRVPIIVVAGCDKEGIEGGVINAISYVLLLKKLGMKVAGVILNRVCMGYLTNEIRLNVNQAFAGVGIELLGTVPVVDLEGRGTIPEVEIRYEDFGAKAIEVAEKSLDLDKIIKAASVPVLGKFDYEKFVDEFKKSLFMEK